MEPEEIRASPEGKLWMAVLQTYADDMRKRNAKRSAIISAQSGWIKEICDWLEIDHGLLETRLERCRDFDRPKARGSFDRVICSPQVASGTVTREVLLCRRRRDPERRENIQALFRVTLVRPCPGGA